MEQYKVMWLEGMPWLIFYFDLPIGKLATNKLNEALLIIELNKSRKGGGFTRGILCL